MKLLTGSRVLAAQCAGSCRRLRWDKKKRAYVCINCGLPDREVQK